MVHRPEEDDRVLDAEPTAELDQGLPFGAVADDPQDARAEPPPVDRQRADHQVGALLGDEPAGADEQRHPLGVRRRGRGMRREVGRHACQPPADDDLLLGDVERSDQVLPGGWVVGHEDVDEARGEPTDDDLEEGSAGSADVAVVALDQGDHLVRPEQLGQARVQPDQPELVDDQDVLGGAGELEEQPRADQLDAHRVLLSRPVDRTRRPGQTTAHRRAVRPSGGRGPRCRLGDTTRPGTGAETNRPTPPRAGAVPRAERPAGSAASYGRAEGRPAPPVASDIGVRRHAPPLRAAPSPPEA